MILNSKQLEAVQMIDYPVLCLSAAGSGKTRTITEKIYYLINIIRINSNKILAITFTNKAAKEMMDRVLKMLGDNHSFDWVRTIHSMCVKILRQDITKLDQGYTNSFIIYDDYDSEKCIKSIIKDIYGSTNEVDVDLIRKAISDAKSRAKRSILESYWIHQIPNIITLYDKYNERLKQSNALDFDDLLLKTAELLLTVKESRLKWINSFDYILVDEYQDINWVQYVIIKLLLGERNCLTAVGDVFQCIYSWRNANPKIMLNFEKSFPNGIIIRLEQNYRSQSNIIIAANKLMEKVSGSWKDKLIKIWGEKPVGDDIYCYSFDYPKDEARLIASKIKEYIKDGEVYSENAVLTRMTFCTRPVEQALIDFGIPYQVVGGQKFGERFEVKTILAYLRVALKPYDEQAFLMSINNPPRGIGDKAISAIKRNYETNWIQALKDTKLSKKANNGALEYLQLIDLIKDLVEEQPSVALKEVVNHTNFNKFILDKYKEYGYDHAMNVNELYKILLDVQSSDKKLSEYLEESALLSDQDDLKNGSEKVSIMTVHASKGLEFDNVFVISLQEGIFPSKRAYSDQERMEEERRLFYVAITRAKKRLTLSYSRDIKFYNKDQRGYPSQYLYDIKDHVKFIDS